MTTNWTLELLTELEGVIEPDVDCHHVLFRDGEKLAIQLGAEKPMRTFYLESHDLQRNPPEIVADIVRSLNALPV